MKHLPDEELERMINATKRDQAKIGLKIDRGRRRILWLSMSRETILLRFWRWRQARLYRVYENLSMGLRALSREARARSLRGYKGQGK